MARTNRRPAALVLIACLAALGTGLTAQFVFHLQPCVLCLYQRVPYAVSAVLALLALLPVRPGTRRALLSLCALAFAINAGIAVFHVGVEQHWWAGLSACEGLGEAVPGSVEALMEALKGPPPARCDQIAFEVMGISMAGANVPASIALAIFAGLAARRGRGRYSR